MCYGRHSRLATLSQCLSSLPASHCRDWKTQILASQPPLWPQVAMWLRSGQWGIQEKSAGDKVAELLGKTFLPWIKRRKQVKGGLLAAPINYSLLPAFVCGYMRPWYMELWQPLCDQEVTRLRTFKNQEAEYDMKEWDNVFDAITELQKPTLGTAYAWTC